MKAGIKRHKVITAFIISLVVVAILEGVLYALGATADVGGVAELMGIGWCIYGVAWLIWEYPKRRRRHG